jgi:hypothetical protein
MALDPLPRSSSNEAWIRGKALQYDVGGKSLVQVVTQSLGAVRISMCGQT